MREFKIGETVQIIEKVVEGERDIVVGGEVGTVCHVLNPKYCIGVEFPYKISYGHTCDSNGIPEHCYYFSPKYLRHVDKIINVKIWIQQNKKLSHN